MYKFINESHNIFYCYCPNTNIEGLIAEIDPPNSHGSELYDIDSSLGQTLFDILSDSSTFFNDIECKLDEGKLNKSLSDVLNEKYNDLHSIRPKDLKPAFIYRWVGSLDFTCFSEKLSLQSRCDYIEARATRENIETITTYLSDCLKSTPSINELFFFLSQHQVHTIGFSTVYLDIDEFFDRNFFDKDSFDPNRLNSPGEDIIEILANHIGASYSCHAEIKQKLLCAYMELAKISKKNNSSEAEGPSQAHLTKIKETLEEIKEKLNCVNIGSHDFICYHIYQVNSLHDLFFATMQEICSQKKRIKICSYCKRLFVPLRHAHEKYCSRPYLGAKNTCESKAKAYQAKVREAIKQTTPKYTNTYKLLEYHNSKNIHIFYEEYRDLKDQLRSGKISIVGFKKQSDLLFDKYKNR